MGCVIEQLEAALQSDDMPSDPDGFAKAFVLMDRLGAKLAAAAAELDASGAWAEDGSLDAAGFVCARGRCSRRQARHVLGVGKKLRHLPVLSQAWADGAVSGSQVEVVLSKVGRHVETFAAQEAELVPTLAALDLHGCSSAMSEWRRRADAISDDDELKPDEPSELYLSETIDGRRELSGHFCPGDAEVVEAALEAAITWGGEGTQLRHSCERRADALVGICRFYLANRDGLSYGRHGTRIAVLVNYDDFAGAGPGRKSDGSPLSPEELQSASCDAVLHRLVYSGASTVLDFGRGTRTINSSLWAALVARDSHCRHPGCDRPAPWCQGHHVVHYSQGGHTRLDNLVLACTRHHHIWHDKGWRLKLGADAVLELTSPSGQRYESRPPPFTPVL
jgi:hypothetical protein